MSEVSVWAYPWDLHDLGLNAALTALSDVGAGMVSMATSYHAGRFLQADPQKFRPHILQ